MPAATQKMNLLTRRRLVNQEKRGSLLQSLVLDVFRGRVVAARSSNCLFKSLH